MANAKKKTTRQERDSEFFGILRRGYRAKAKRLKANGWEIRLEGQAFNEHFQKTMADGQVRRIQICRKLGSTEWYYSPYQTYGRIDEKDLGLE